MLCKKKRLAVRVAIVTMALVTVIGFSSTQALAAATVDYYYGTDQQTGKTVRTGIKEIDLDGKTYYDVGGNTLDVTLDSQLFKQAMDNIYDKDGTFCDSPLNNWARVAVPVFRDQGVMASHFGETGPEFDKYYDNDHYQEHPGGMPEVYCIQNLATSLAHEDSYNMGNHNSYPSITGIQTASCLNDMREGIADAIANKIQANGYSCNKEGLLTGFVDFNENGALPEMKSTDSSNGIYNVVVSADMPVDGTWRYSAFGLGFYDFKLRPLADDDIKMITAAEAYKDKDDPVKAAAEAKREGCSYTSNTDTVSAYTENGSEKEVDQSLAYNHTLSSEVHTTVRQESSVSFSQMVGYEIEFGAEELKHHIKAEFTFQEAYTTAREKEEGLVNSTSHEATTSVTLPPQTAIQIIESNTDTDVKVDYSQPMELLFKVVIFSLHGSAATTLSDPYNVAGASYGYFSTSFGNDGDEYGLGSGENLYRRAVTNYDDSGYDKIAGKTAGYHRCKGAAYSPTSTDCLHWGSILEHATSISQDDFNNQAAQMKTFLPLIGNGCGIYIKNHEIKSDVGSISPLYLLTKVRLTEGQSAYDMTVGDKLDLSSLHVEGYNKNNVPYFGFDETEGHWEVCDAEGNVVTDSDIVEIDTNQLTHISNVLAKNPGKAYLKWNLNDGVEYTAEKDTGKTTNQNLTDTAFVEINVSEAPFLGSATITGDYIGYVDDPSEPITNGLDVMIQDENEVEVSRPYTWEALELSTRGIDLEENGTVSFTKPGTFHVHVNVTGTDITSPWKEIQALPARELTYMQATDPEQKKITPEIRSQSYDLASFVKFYDQYDKEWTKETPALQFALPEGTEGAVIEDGILTVTKGGEYPVTVTAEGLDPITINVSVKEYIGIDEPAAITDLVYTGTEQAGVPEGEGYTLKNATATNAGTYEATVSLEDGYMWSNAPYEGDRTIEFTIAPATLTAKYNLEIIKMGTTPALVVDVFGFVNGETPETAAGYVAPTITAPTDMECDKTYELTPEGGAADNYVFQYETGRLIVTHDLVKVPLVKATDKKEGNILYYKCNVCGLLFADKDATQPLTEEETIIPKVQLTIPDIYTMSLSSKKMKVMWAKDPNASGYQVATKQIGKSKWTLKKTTKTSMTISKLKAGKMYQIKVRAYKNETALTKAVKTKYSGVDGRYNKAVKVTKCTAGTGQITVKWKKDKKASGYTVLYSATNKLEDPMDQTGINRIQIKGKNKLSTKITGLEAGTKYYVSVRPNKTYKGKTYKGIHSAVKTVTVK